MTCNLKHKLRSSITDEKQGAKSYSKMASSEGLEPSERKTIRSIAKDERGHKSRITKIYKRISSR